MNAAEASRHALRLAAAGREIAEKREAVARSAFRQGFHLMPETGWMNDPNGLIYFRGKYHFFYQFYPYAPRWGSMHWGHAVSDDLLRWEHLPPALAPSEEYDDHPSGGCFSGSAIEHGGRLYLFYTGCADRGRGMEQTQNLAFSDDGIHFEKYSGNPLLTAPEGVPPDSFRDPKVWRQGDTFFLICGASRAGRAQILLYRSDDLLHWEFFRVLYESRGEWGDMFECPDFFELQGSHVLVFSPMGCGERKSVYLTGDFDARTGKFFPKVTGELDWGFQYYAPASFLAPDGRRILAAWANGWQWMPFWKSFGPTERDGWCGAFTLPREARLQKDGTLSLLPVRELQQLRKNEADLGEAVLSEGESLPLRRGCRWDAELAIDLSSPASSAVFTLRSANGNRTVLTVDLLQSELRLDLTASDGSSSGIARAPLDLAGQDTLPLRLCSDRISLEIFAGGGRSNISCNVYTTAENEENFLTAEGGELKLWDLRCADLEM